ncbi:NADH-quinone oxidoreductase subunit J [Pseudaquidulcibacter saccharophilus]|uniref:NADH-quinone oxidoreductase subunit J n=1 Tax=Pseudaquidulcibacter saccharophilus TaxID=2831900 RepID=UPI001EFF2C1F
MVVSAKNPVHSVMFLITIFVTTSGLFVLAGAEYLAMLLIVVYVGAVAVLFLFVVMMLDIDFVELKQGFMRYAPFGALVALVLFAMFVLVASAVVEAKVDPHVLASPTPALDVANNTQAIGRILYTDYILFFQLAGMVLFVAMIGAIVLTLRHKPYVKRQNVGKQVARTRKTGVENTKPKIGEGVSL